MQSTPTRAQPAAARGQVARRASHAEEEGSWRSVVLPAQNDHGPPPGTRDRPSDTGSGHSPCSPTCTADHAPWTGRCPVKSANEFPGRLEGAQVPLLLPLRDLDAVLVPLPSLELDVAWEDVVAERTLHELRAGELLDRLAERLRQRHDPALLPLVGREAVQIGRHLRRQLVALLDALQPGLEQGGERQVGVARGVRAADLGARALLGARLVEGHTHERGA